MASRVVPLGVTSFLKASLKNRLWLIAFPSYGRCRLWLLPSRWILVDLLAVPMCALILLALVCLAALDIVIAVYHSRADALPLSLLVSSLADAFAAEGVMVAPLYRRFAVGGVFVSSSVDTYWSSMKPLTDALSLLALWSPLW